MTCGPHPPGQWAAARHFFGVGRGWSSSRLAARLGRSTASFDSDAFWQPTNTGGEEFDAWAVIDQNLDSYGELDGDEAACEFGPAADHPNPDGQFDDLPESGQWELLELLSWCDASSEC